MTISSLSLKNTQVKDEDIRILERFLCFLYSRATTFDKVNEFQGHLFTKQGRLVGTIPPTKDALLQHIKRVVYRVSLAQSVMSLIMRTIGDLFLELNVSVKLHGI